MWGGVIDPIDDSLKTRKRPTQPSVVSIHPFKGDLVVLVGERRELCSVEKVEKVKTS